MLRVGLEVILYFSVVLLKNDSLFSFTVQDRCPQSSTRLSIQVSSVYCPLPRQMVVGNMFLAHTHSKDIEGIVFDSGIEVSGPELVSGLFMSKERPKVVGGREGGYQQGVYEPPRGKTNNVVSEQVRHKPTCTSTEKS